MKSIYNFILEKLTLNNQSKLSQKEQSNWSIEDAKDGDIITDYRKYNNSKLIYIFKKIDRELIFAYCYYDFKEKKFEITGSNSSGMQFGIRFLMGYKHKFDYWLSTEEEKQELFEAAAKNGYKWDPIKKELKKV